MVVVVIAFVVVVVDLIVCVDGNVVGTLLDFH